MIALGEAECCALAGTDCRPTPLRRRASRPQLKRNPLGAHEHLVHSVHHLLLRLGFAVFGLALMRDGYAALRGRALCLQGPGASCVFLPASTCRFAGAFLLLV